MSKFCGNCGSMAPDDARVCGQCGTPFAEAPVQNAYSTNPGGYEAPVQNTYDPNAGAYGAPAAGYGYAPPAPKKKSPLGWIIGGIAALLVVVGLIFGIRAIFGGGGGVDGFLKAYCEAMETGKDGDKILDYMPEYVKEMDEYEDVKDFLKETFEEIHEAGEEEFGEGYKVSYEIIDETELDDDELDEIKEEIESECPDDYDVDKIKAAKEVEVELTIEGDEKEDSDETTFLFIKEGSKWKFFGGGMI